MEIEYYHILYVCCITGIDCICEYSEYIVILREYDKDGRKCSVKLQ